MNELRSFEFKGGNDYFGVSRPHMDQFVTLALKKLENIKTAIDLGSGRGKMGSLIKETFPDANIIGVDANNDSQEWIGEFLPNIYSTTVCSDVIEFLDKYKDKVELIVAGDVFEHLNEDQFLSALEKIKKMAKYLLVISPIQSEEDLSNNHNTKGRTGLERHQIVLSPKKIRVILPEAKVIFVEKKKTTNLKGENPYEKFVILLQLKQ